MKKCVHKIIPSMSYVRSNRRLFVVILGIGNIIVKLGELLWSKNSNGTDNLRVRDRRLFFDWKILVHVDGKIFLTLYTCSSHSEE